MKINLNKRILIFNIVNKILFLTPKNHFKNNKNYIFQNISNIFHI